VSETLPDGGTVSSQFGPEGWECIGVSFPDQQFPTEGWEAPIFIMGEFTASPSSQTVEAGNPATIEGQAQDETGSPMYGGIPFTVELRDGDGNVVDSASGTTASDGSYTGEVTPPEPGEYEAVTVNDRIGRQAATEGFEEIGVSFSSQFGPEGWET
jgi:hypothetical protein